MVFLLTVQWWGEKSLIELQEKIPLHAYGIQGKMPIGVICSLLIETIAFQLKVILPSTHKQWDCTAICVLHSQFFSSKAIQRISFSVFQKSVRTERPSLGRPRKSSGHFKVLRGLIKESKDKKKQSERERERAAAAKQWNQSLRFNFHDTKGRNFLNLGGCRVFYALTLLFSESALPVKGNIWSYFASLWFS